MVLYSGSVAPQKGINTITHTNVIPNVSMGTPFSGVMGSFNSNVRTNVGIIIRHRVLPLLRSRWKVCHSHSMQWLNQKDP
jgi:hypothetical protein